MGKVVRLLPPPAPDPEDEAIPVLIAAVMREARRRSGQSPHQFAAAINSRCGRQAALLGSSVEEFERGALVPRADVYLAALALGGYAIREALAVYLAGA